MKTYSLSICLLLLLLVSSCVPPARNAETMYDIPDHWLTEASEQSVDANIRWWEQFEDPVLDGLIFEALQNNQDIRVAIANVEAFYARWVVVRSALFPQVDQNVSVNRQEISLDLNALPSGTTRVFNQYNFLTNVFYELDLWGRIQSASDAAFAELIAKEEVNRTVILTVVSATAASYVRIGQLDLQLEIALRTLMSRNESYELAKKRFSRGATSQMEVRQAESVVESAKAEIIRLETLLAQEENMLSILVGRVPSRMERGKTLEQWKLPPQVPAGLPSTLLQQRPDIIQAEELLIAADAHVDEARAAFYPNISLTGFFGFESLELKNLFKNRAQAWQYGVNLLQPIFTGWRLTGRLEEAKAQRCAALHQYFQAILVAFKEVEDALVAHKKALELVEVQRQHVFVLQEYLRLANLQYRNGQTDYLNVLDAERNLFAVQLDLALAQSECFLSLIELYRALGGGWVVDAEELTSQEMECMESISEE